MKKILILTLCLFYTSFLGAQSNITPMNTIKNVYGLLKKYDVKAPNAKKQKAVINDYWLLDEIALDAIKDQWSKMNKKQQDRYMIVMKKLLEKTIYEDTGDKLKKGISRIYKQETLTPKKSMVRTKLTVKKNNITVSNDYGMTKVNGIWKIRDIYIDGQNLAEDYRSQYNQIVEKNGIEGNSNALLERIEKSIQKDSDWYNFSDDDGKKDNKKSEEKPKKVSAKPRPSLLS